MSATITLDPLWGGNPVLQRTFDNHIYLRIEGSYSGGTPSGIQARIEDGSGNTVLDWFDCVSGTLGHVDFDMQTFSGRGAFPAPVFPLRLKVRFTNDFTVTAQSALFTVGDVFLLMGQSNMERFTGVLAGSPLTKLGYQAITIPDPLEAAALGLTGTSLWQSTTGDGLITLANMIASATGYPVGFIFLSRGGTPLCKESANPLTQYLLSTEGSIDNFPVEAYLTASLNQVRAACKANAAGADFLGIFEIHGEGDTSATTGASYIAGNTDQFNCFLAISPRKSGSSIVYFQSICGKFSSNNDACTRIAQAQIRWAQVTPGAVISSDRYDLPRSDGDGIFVHLSAAGCKTLGYRLGADFAHWWNPVAHPVPGSGPFLKSGTRSGNVITLSLNLNGHSGVAAMNPSSPLTGFKVSVDDFATLIGITNAVLSSGQIVLTLASTPAGMVQVQYVITSTASDPTDNLIYSTDLIPGDAKGAPLRLTDRPITTF